MEEKVFLDAPYGTVSTSKMVINGSTYATRNVSSVRIERIARPLWPWLVIVLGGALALNTIREPMVGLIVLAVGVILALALTAKAKLHLVAGGGERVAMESSNIKAIDTLHAAIVEAISQR